MNNNFCSNCGNAIDSNNRFCSKCGKEIISTTNNINTINTNNYITVILGISSLLLFFFGGIIMNFFVFGDKMFFLSMIPSILGIIIMIIGRIKYPNSSFLKVVMWILIGWGSIIIILLIFMLFLIITGLIYV